MQPDFANCTEEELWHYVASHLAKEGIETILVGGAVVSIYSEGAYRSGDLDLVLGSMFVKNLDQAMQKIGFKKKGRHFEHPECRHLFVEFPGSPPLGIGSDYTIRPDEVAVESHICLNGLGTSPSTSSPMASGENLNATLRHSSA